MRAIHILIDGYNLIGTGHADLKAARERLIDEIVRFKKARGHDVTVVFDGWIGGLGGEAKTVIGGVAVIYSAIGERADSVIKRIISPASRKWVVVSSDRDIASFAWSSSSVPVSSEVFYRLLLRVAGGEGTDFSDEQCWDTDESDDAKVRKGNRERRSKKDREIERVLEKL